jgi:hypothetical protein
MNISKSNFFSEQIEYLRYWITRQDIQPICNKVEIHYVIDTKASKTRKEDRTTQIYWYSQLLLRHVLLQKWASSQVALTSLTLNKVKFEWFSSHQQSFDKIKKVVETKIQLLLWYLDFSKPVRFHLYTNASGHRLGAVIMQDKNPIVFYSWKFNISQKRYKTNEREWELLSAIETCKEYRNILLAYPIIVFGLFGP